jgi:MFS family permease
MTNKRATGIVAKNKWRIMLPLAVSRFIDQGEVQAISVLFPTLQKVWGLSYANLGTLGTIRYVLQAVAAPLWGYAADKYSRKKVIIFGAGIWGLWTLICGLTQNFGQLLAVRAISGIGLGCLMPAAFSIISDVYPPERRGRALGTLEGIGFSGIVIFTLGLGMLATPSLWRWGFILLGSLSVLSGLLVWWLVDEPVRGAAEPELAGRITKKDATRYVISAKDTLKIFKIPTIWVAIAQGTIGTMPWVILGQFLITWFVNERGWKEQDATVAFASIVIGTVISNILGGYIGDKAEKLSPRYGRAAIGQFSVISGIPLTYILFTQTGTWSLEEVVVLCLITALFISWAGKGAKEPMMQGVTLPEIRSMAFSVVSFVEIGFAALVAVIAGVIADRIGLTQALLWTVPFPWIICAVIFSLFYWSYPRDSVKLRAQMTERAEELSI